MKKIIVGIFSFALLFVGQSVFATYAVWNNASNDCPTINVANTNGSVGWGNPCWSGTNINAQPGDIVNVRVYYHNNGSVTANNTRLVLNAPSGSSTRHAFSAKISSNQGGLQSGSVYINLPSSQTLTFGSVDWYTGNTNPTITPLLNGQNGSEILTSSGLYIGDITAGWPSQGSAVVSFVVGNNTPPPAPSCSINSFTASPASITNGSSSTLNWNTSNCTNVNISNLTYSVPVTGTQSVWPTYTTTYTLTANGSNGGTQTRSVTVSVNDVVQNCSINSFTASPTVVTSGSPVVFNWNTSDCTSVTISNLSYSVPLSGTQSFWPTHTATYTLTAISYGVIQTRSIDVFVNNTPPPVLNCSINSFTASPTSITNGSSSTLNWNTSNCTNVNISNLTYSVPVTGTQSVWPTYTTTYTLTASGSSGVSQTRSVTVNVSAVAQNCSINSFTASPTSITNGSSSTLNWNTSNCTNVNISNLTYSVPVTGTQSVWPTYTTTYTLTATGTNGSNQSRSVVVSVNNVTPNCSINSFTASPTSITNGGSSTLNWNTSNCSRVTIEGIGSVPESGSRTIWPSQTTTYTLVIENHDGNTIDRVTTRVYVDDNNHDNERCEISNFTASDTSIDEGDSTTLRWNTDNCSRVKISNVGSVSLDGNKNVYPNGNTTYVLTAYDYNGSAQTKSLRIYVDENNNNNSYCNVDSFTSSNINIRPGDSITLRWSTSNCSSVNISNLGNVSSNGNKTIYPAGTTVYVLNAYGNRSESRSIQVNVNYNVIPTPTPNPIPVYNSNVVTTVATNISQTGAQVNGLITSSNYPNANTYFEYGPNITLGSRTLAKTVNSNTNFSDYLTNLSPKTIYFFQAISEGPNGISRGAIEVFETLGNVSNNTQVIKQVVYQGTTVTGSQSPIMLKIENRYQAIGVGDVVDYVVTYKNIGKSKLTNPMVQVFIPKGLTLVNTSRGTYSEDSRTLSVPIEDLISNAEGTIYLQAKVDSIESNLAQVVTTAVLVYTNPNGAQENAMAYVLNNPKDNSNLLGASAFFGDMFGMGLIGWLLLIIFIMLLVLIARTFYIRKNTPVGTNHY